jgi:hypothetical protein
MPSNALLERTRLPRQPGSLEGLGTVAIAPVAGDLPVTQREDVEGREPHFHAATSATAGLHPAYNHMVSTVEHFLGLKAVRIPCSEPLGKPPLDLVAATVDLPADRDPGRNLPFDLGVKRRERGLIIGAVIRTEQRTHELHVLLRHRPPSISREPATGPPLTGRAASVL